MDEKRSLYDVVLKVDDKCRVAAFVLLHEEIQ
jgi:hypothetical protein